MGNTHEREAYGEYHNDQRIEEGERITQRLSRSVNTYLRDTVASEVLRPHQLRVFQDLKQFFENGHTRGYIELPTGSGKTVLFVELSKAVLSAAENTHRPKILVVTATKDLVHQTLGRTGEKGYGRFAPELAVGSYFTDTPKSKKRREDLKDFDVVVTTYRSFALMGKYQGARVITDEDRERLLQEDPYYAGVVAEKGKTEALRRMRYIKYVSTTETLLDMFDIIVFDEAHHVFGETTNEIVTSLSDEKVIIGFTATPDAGSQKKLEQYLPEKIHSLDLNEAIWLGLLAPVFPIGIHSGLSIQGSNLYDRNGEFIDGKISYLAESPERNKLIISAAKAFAQEGVGTIISCIAGNGAWHAKHLAAELQNQGVRSVAVHSKIPAKVRQKIYTQFENGEIDVLTFVGVLGEGWDSTRAKALIGARPTRSEIFSKQRLGRITRPGGIAYAVDILDQQEEKNPIITIADVLNEGPQSFGNLVGTDDAKSSAGALLAILQTHLPVVPVLETVYRDNEQLLLELEVLEKGALYSKHAKRKVRDWAVASRIVPRLSGVTDTIIEKAEQQQGVRVSRKLARQGNIAKTVYDVLQANLLMIKLPSVDTTKYYIDQERRKWISQDGLVQLFSRKYPALTRTILSTLLLQIEEELEWMPARNQETIVRAGYEFQKIVILYAANSNSISKIETVISSYFRGFLALDHQQLD